MIDYSTLCDYSHLQVNVEMSLSVSCFGPPPDLKIRCDSPSTVKSIVVEARISPCAMSIRVHANRMLNALNQKMTSNS